MTTINKRSQLNLEIKKSLWQNSPYPLDYPRVLTYCLGIGSPTFRITIEKLEPDVFVDSQGRKWVRAKDDEVTE